MHSRRRRCRWIKSLTVHVLASRSAALLSQPSCLKLTNCCVGSLGPTLARRGSP
ncbi:hypothetical protein PF005_g32260 [Phytophthora fragariae]|uniref:Uncharacterized protein n=2 Tax=Phytophthora TaxID=4783 RepID=A0A6A3V158_9STRA|nr:hypothetical protein PF003_g18352 [Phytophthora fragariae]KAE8991280.1 hypothetical protein PR001_g21274 [Phytophthora rubi]KAE8917431.1 hypothetical protein PF009_g32248 [Phytophthora fragariae]KAE8955838.1 hypothetical protein PF011_g31677 [Phytophthora fragariae]KAE8992432.1 hypothetical protein PR002_g20547 [Phytophthora rubi]